MSKVVLSTGYEFEIAPEGYGATGDTVYFSIISDDKTLDEIEHIFTGVDQFKVIAGEDEADPSVISNFYGYIKVQTLSKIPEYNVGVNMETGEVIYKAVSTVTCSKRDIADRMSDMEDTVDDLVISILGGDELLASLGGSEEEPAAAGEDAPVEE